MKKIKDGEYKGTHCHQCDRAAEWRGNRLTGPVKMYACSLHKQSIIDAEAKAPKHDSSMNEADMQSWANL